MDTIEAMRVFVNVARQKSFTQGAKQSDLSTKLASKYVRQLEARLDAQLFYRTTRSVTLTETGRAYYKRCQPILEQFDELEDLVQDRQKELSGTIRLTASTGFGSKELIEPLLSYQKQHPEVKVNLRLSDNHIAVVEEGVDIAIRFGKLQDSNLMARKLKDMRVVFFASPDYLSLNGLPTHPEELVDHNCLLFRSSTDSKNWHFNLNGQIVSCPVSGTFNADSPRAITNMSRGGLGIGIGPYYAVENHVKSGELTLLFEEMEVEPMGLYAVYPENRHLTARIRALIDHLVAWFND
ncbi:LysR substrate-binding domain-containing protein [Vibrio cyclitrophicus]|uniref:LysR family transcriptional regulator n=1 Tax=Vibrio cyclitrophicus TaxID=47951 RepID=UPI0039998DA3